MPGPVRGFAASLLREKLSLPQNQMSVIDNTARFDVPALLKVLMSFGTRSMQEMPINYPYWENIARGWEDILALILLIRVIGLRHISPPSLPWRQGTSVSLPAVL